MLSRGSNVKEHKFSLNHETIYEQSTITSLGVRSGVFYRSSLEYLPHVLGREHSI